MLTGDIWWLKIFHEILFLYYIFFTNYNLNVLIKIIQLYCYILITYKLITIYNFLGKPCTIILYDNSKVKATFVTTTGAYDHIAVENLHTPIGIVSSALIRTKDIQSLELEIGRVFIFFN